MHVHKPTQPVAFHAHISFGLSLGHWGWECYRVAASFLGAGQEWGGGSEGHGGGRHPLPDLKPRRAGVSFSSLLPAFQLPGSEGHLRAQQPAQKLAPTGAQNRCTDMGPLPPGPAYPVKASRDVY